MRGRKFRAWVTRYALTKGEVEAAVEDCFDTAAGMVKDINSTMTYYHGNDWHRERDDAYARVREMIKAARKSLKKKADKLDKLEETVG